MRRVGIAFVVAALAAAVTLSGAQRQSALASSLPTPSLGPTSGSPGVVVGDPGITMPPKVAGRAASSETSGTCGTTSNRYQICVTLGPREPAATGPSAPRAKVPASSNTIQPLPSDCIGSGYLYTEHRFYECEQYPSAEATETDSDTGAIIAQAIFQITYYTNTNATDPDIATQVSLIPTSSTGDIQVSGVAACSDDDGNCVPGDTNFPRQDLVDGIEVDGEAGFQWTGGSGQYDYENANWTLTFYDPDGNEAFIDEDIYSLRCDNAVPGISYAGCDFNDDVPYIEYKAATYPTLVQHIQAAQESGLPGGLDTYPLTRTTDPATRSANRSVACPSTYTRPSGYSCDEYPFASTYEGASAYPGGGRTFPWCQISQLPQDVSGDEGYSSCMINATENSSGGSALNSQLYVPYRIIDADAFNVLTG